MGAGYAGTFTIDAQAEPKMLDLLFTEGPHAGMTSPAIYNLDDDCLTIRLGFAGRTRPTEFVTSPGSGNVLETLRREPPPEPSTSNDSSKENPSESIDADGLRSISNSRAMGVSDQGEGSEEMARLQGE